MPKAMSDEVSNVVVQALEKGLSRNQIAGVCGISKRAVTRINTNLRKYGTSKPPPSGIKQGRPLRITSAQAQAMLPWMAECNYVFYVKDLVQYLREEHGYRGCDGTVRRVLLRAGFKIKLPWHKSEITTWIPPEVMPSFEQVTAEESSQDSALTEVDSSNVSHRSDQIDPSLEQASMQLLLDSRTPMFGNDAQAPPHILAKEAGALHAPEQQQTPVPSSLEIPKPTSKSATNSGRPKRKNQPKSAQGASAVTDSEELQDTVTNLQGKISEQQALIAQLQQQLAQQASQVQASAASQAEDIMTSNRNSTLGEGEV